MVKVVDSVHWRQYQSNEKFSQQYSDVNKLLTALLFLPEDTVVVDGQQV